MAGQPLLLSLLLAVLLTVLPAEAAKGATKLPSYMRKCSLKDPNVEQCALESGRVAVPKLVKGESSLLLPTLDPLEVPEVRIQSGNDASRLDMTCKNIILKGLADTDLIGIGIDQKNRIYSAICRIPRLQISADYIVDGKVLLLPVKGTGKANFTFENAFMRYDQHYVLEKRNGRTYLTFPESSGKFNCSKAYFHLDNLFNGDERLGSTVNNFMNENWQAVVDDLGQPFVDAAVKIIEQFSAVVVGNVPFDEIWNDADVL